MSIVLSPTDIEDLTKRKRARAHENRIDEMLRWRTSEIMRRNSRTFRVLPLDQLRGLRRVDARSSGGGVYFLWRGPQLLYIGKSNNIGYRLLQHWRGGKRFTHATLEEIAEECTRRCEQKYALKYSPPLNRTRLG